MIVAPSATELLHAFDCFRHGCSGASMPGERIAVGRVPFRPEVLLTVCSTESDESDLNLLDILPDVRNELQRGSEPLDALILVGIVINADVVEQVRGDPDERRCHPLPPRAAPQNEFGGSRRGWSGVRGSA